MAAGKSKVGNFALPGIKLHQAVGWCDVTVRQMSLLVRIDECLCHLHGQIDSIALWNDPLLPQNLTNGRALDVLYREIRTTHVIGLIVELAGPMFSVADDMP